MQKPSSLSDYFRWSSFAFNIFNQNSLTTYHACDALERRLLLRIVVVLRAWQIHLMHLKFVNFGQQQHFAWRSWLMVVVVAVVVGDCYCTVWWWCCYLNYVLQYWKFVVIAYNRQLYRQRWCQVVVVVVVEEQEHRKKHVRYHLMRQNLWWVVVECVCDKWENEMIKGGRGDVTNE